MDIRYLKSRLVAQLKVARAVNLTTCGWPSRLGRRPFYLSNPTPHTEERRDICLRDPGELHDGPAAGYVNSHPEL